MALQSTDITFRLSGGAGNTNQNASLGGAKSTILASASLFDDVSGTEASAGLVEYRCIYLNNSNLIDSYLNVKLWIQTNTPSPDSTIAVGLGTSGLNGTEQTVVNETTAPIGVSFSSPADVNTALNIGTIPANQHFAYWIRRTITPGAAAFADSFTIRVQGDSNP